MSEHKQADEAAEGQSRLTAELGANPNNCDTCDHMANNYRGGGHCYMFRDAPTGVCMAHTGRKLAFAHLMASQVPLGHEFAEVLHANLWDLYESDGPVPNAPVKGRD